MKIKFFWGIFISGLLYASGAYTCPLQEDLFCDELVVEAVDATLAQLEADETCSLLRRPLALEEQREMLLQQQFQDMCEEHIDAQRSYFIMKAVAAYALTVLTGSLALFYGHAAVKKFAENQ